MLHAIVLIHQNWSFAEAIAVGRNFVCGVMTNRHELQCWGDDGFGQKLGLCAVEAEILGRDTGRPAAQPCPS